MLIEAALEACSDSIQSFSTGDVIAILVATISLVGAIITTIFTNKTAKDIRKDNEAFQAKWNQKNIDASLTASARIDWIQKVRGTTAELIALYFKALNITDKPTLLDTVMEAQEKTELLILFFGHEKKQAESVNLFCLENNDNKNYLIVDFLSALSTKLFKYYQGVKSDKLTNLKAIRDRRLDEMHQHIVGCEYEESQDEHGLPNVTENPILEDNYQKELDDINARIDDVIGVSKEIYADLLQLRDIIRTYLKIEWNIAKKGE